MTKLIFQNFLLNLFAGLMVFTVLPSCNKASDDPQVTNDATLTIVSPREGKDYGQGPLTISATLTGIEDLHGYELFIRRKSDGMVLFTKDVHDHALTINISEIWVNDVTVKTDLEMEIIATLDHEGNTESFKINFIANP